MTLHYTYTPINILVQSLMIDCKATNRYWHLVKLMGHSASHVTMDVALNSHPNFVVLSEEVISNQWSAKDVSRQCCDVIQRRYDLGKHTFLLEVRSGGVGRANCIWFHHNFVCVLGLTLKSWTQYRNL